MLRVKASGFSIESLYGLTKDFETFPAEGILLGTGPGKGRDALTDIRETLHGSPYRAYLNVEAFGYGPDKIAVIKSIDQYDYLDIVRTDGITYDLEHEPEHR